MISQKIRLGDYCDIIKGAIGIKKAISGEYPLVVTAEKRLSHNEFQFDDIAILIPLVSSTGHGHASMKRIHYQEGKFALGTILCAVIIKDTNIINPRYLYIYLSYFKDHLLVPLMKGAANVTLSIKKIKTVEIPLPSIERQLEIIELEKNNSKIQDLNLQIDKQKQLLTQLKQSILQEAIQGKLTEDWRKQHPNTEPANELLKRIKAKKEQLIKDKKIKKEKLLPPITKEEIPFELPMGWVWCKLGDIGKSIIGLVYKPANVNDSGTPVLRANNIVDYKLIETNLVHVDCEVPENKIAEKGDILICVRSGSKKLIGKSAIITKNGFSFGAFNTLYKSLFNNYVHLFLMSTTFTNQINDEKSTGINQLTQGVLRNLIIPFPPLEEQKAIVEKIETLMQQCQALEQETRSSEVNAQMLMQAVLKEAFESKKEEVEV